MNSDKKVKICIDSLNYYDNEDIKKIKLIKKIFGNTCYVNIIADDDDIMHTYIIFECNEEAIDFIYEILDDLHVDR